MWLEIFSLTHIFHFSKYKAEKIFFINNKDIKFIHYVDIVFLKKKKKRVCNFFTDCTKRLDTLDFFTKYFSNNFLFYVKILSFQKFF